MVQLLTSPKNSEDYKKSCSKILIVCGGYLTAVANTVLRKTDVDVCVVGDGEVAWVGLKLCQKKQKNKKIYSIVFKVKIIAY